MSLMPPRLSAAELTQAQRAGYAVTRRNLAPGPGHKRTSLFGSMFSWFPTLRFGRSTFWPAQGNAKPPINAVESDSGQIVTPASALTLSTVWACVWLVSRTLATLPLELKRYGQNGAGVPETDDPLFNVLRWQPNAKMTAADFWTFMWASEQLWGSGYAEKKFNAGKVIALEPLLPEYMTPYLTDTGQLRYRYDDPRSPREFRADQMFHLKTRTLDGITGQSVIESARNSMGIAQAGEQASSMTFKNGLQAGGFIKVDKFLKPDQRELFRTELAEFQHEGTKRGGLMVLEGGTDFKELTIKPQDAELLESRQFSVEDVCRWFGVPPILIGHSSAGQTMWGSGVEQIFSGWTRLQLRPLCAYATQQIRFSLIPPSDRPQLYGEYDLDELLAADSQARASLYSSMTQNGIMTRNEAREKEGLPKMDGGDELTVQSNLVPIGQLGEQAQGAATQASENVRNALLDFLNLRGVGSAGEQERKP